MRKTTNSRPAKTVPDAIQDAVGALNDLIRSFRSRAKVAGKSAKRTAKEAARGVRGDLDANLHRAGKAALDASQSLRDRLKDAWHVLTDAKNGASRPSRARRAPRAKSRTRGRRAAPRARRTTRRR
jgi:hypothetical protein